MDNTQEIEEAADIIQLVISTLNDLAAETGTPNFQELVAHRIKEYAHFTNSVMQASSSSAVESIIRENEDAKELNDKVQQYIKLAHRGLVSINPSELIRVHVYNPLVQEISDHESGLLVSEGDGDTDYSDFSEVVHSVVISTAAAQLLGGIKYWAEMDAISPEQFALVHPISSTRH